MPHHESEPLLPAPVTHPHPSGAATATSPTTTRSKLNARRMSSGPAAASPTSGGERAFGMSEKSRGKQRAVDEEAEDLQRSERGDAPASASASGLRGAPPSPGKRRKTVGRHVTVIFSGDDGGGSEGNLDLWAEDGESVGAVKEQIRHLRPRLAGKSLRLIHSGRLLTDGILLLGWLRSLEERVKRQTGGVGRDVESVLKDVGLAEGEEGEEGEGGGAGSLGTAARKDGGGRVWLHCVVGSKAEEPEGVKEDEPTAPRRRGFDVLLDAGLSAADVAAMRRQFYESRGEEVPEDMGETNDEHARALEEQWIEGDMTAETAATSTEGMFTSTLHGLLAGFLFPITPWFFFREVALPNFFDADAEAAGEADPGGVHERVADNVGGEILPSVVFGKRMQMGILFGTILNLAFGALRFIN